MLRERTDTFKTDVGDRPLREDDAGIVKKCDYCGFRFDEELLRRDERGYWACPTHMFDPQPEPIIVE
jgi:hypothetical protein